MYSSVQLYLIVGVLAFLTHSAYGVSCYACESDNNPNCGENFNEEGIPKVDCQDQPVPRYLLSFNEHIKPTGCKKQVLEDGDGKQIIQRFCYFGPQNDTKKEGCRREQSLSEKKTLKCEVCTEDLCNGSFVLHSDIALIIPLLFSIFGVLSYSIF